ncbi:hypothetical protein [Nocardia blacklockiae]|uniref:hypothetical protein n=1 Tax=Nocardia blacklockiae TaxID=480036 RepID=UPI0018943758|nr:hypothetical protein [Nocardia blacklockiae]MBF6171085.1 hypothetical protein [Nocardia blacklockiae]
MVVVPVAQRYGRMRPREGDDTLSWCALPLAAAWTEMVAQVVQVHRDVVAEGAW